MVEKLIPQLKPKQTDGKFSNMVRFAQNEEL